MSLAGWLALLLHAALFTAAAPVATGLLRWMQGRLAGRAGPPVTQPWRDLRRLLRKPPVTTQGSSWITAAAPALALAALAAGAALVPSFTLGMATAPAADLVALAGLLAAARAVMALAGLDTGAAVGGIGASRTLTQTVMGEPALLLVVLVFAVLTGFTNVDAAAGAIRDGTAGLRLGLLLTLPPALLVALVQTGQAAPATLDAPAMATDALAQAYSGWQLALVEAGSALRLLLWLSLLGVLFLPFGIATSGAGPLSWLVGLLAWGGKTVGLLAALALLQAGRTRLPAVTAPGLLGAAVLLALVAAVLLFTGQGGA